MLFPGLTFLLGAVSPLLISVWLFGRKRVAWSVVLGVLTLMLGVSVGVHGWNSRAQYVQPGWTAMSGLATCTTLVWPPKADMPGHPILSAIAQGQDKAHPQVSCRTNPDGKPFLVSFAQADDAVALLHASQSSPNGIPMYQAHQGNTVVYASHPFAWTVPWTLTLGIGLTTSVVLLLLLLVSEYIGFDFIFWPWFILAEMFG